MIKFQNTVAGEAVAASDTFETFDPYSGKAWALIPKDGPTEVDRAVAAAKSAFKGEWRSITATARGKLLMRLADLISENAQRLAELETRDNGKLIAEMAAQLGTCLNGIAISAACATKLRAMCCP